MNVTIYQSNDSPVASLQSEELLITDVQSALDLIATVQYEHASHKLVIPAQNIHPDFFDLKTRLAGDILQKFANYGVRIAITGDFSQVESKSLRDFIYECNNGSGKHIAFSADEAAAVSALTD